MSAVPVARSWRSSLCFSVRGLIVLVLLIGGGMGWLVRSARIQRDAVAAIEKDGGGVRYDWQWSNGVFIPGGKPWAPQWLVNLIGVDFFGHVTDAALSPFSTSPDATTEHVGRLTRLRYLNLNQTPLTDAGLAHVKALTELVYLNLNGTEITDSGLVRLTGLTKLSSLQLARTHVTDAGIKELQQALPSLKITH